MRDSYRLGPPVVLWWVWLVFVAANLVDWLAQGTSARLALTAGVIMLAVTGAVYALALRPRVVADDEGLTVLNPFRVHRVPWPAVADVDTADWVMVRTGTPDKPAGTIYCWALYVSARSRRAANRPPRRSPLTSRLRGITVEPGTGISPRLPGEARYLASLPPAKAIAATLAGRAEKARKRGDATAEPATARWAWFPVAAVVVPLAAVLVVLLAG